MTETPRCPGHQIGFEHLEADFLGGPETEFDLGFKFEELYPRESSVHPKTGIESWPAPYLALYVSLTPFQSPDSTLRTLHYGLIRSKWDTEVASTERDRQKLLELAKSPIREDLSAVKRGEKPENLLKSEPRML